MSTAGYVSPLRYMSPNAVQPSRTFFPPAAQPGLASPDDALRASPRAASRAVRPWAASLSRGPTPVQEAVPPTLSAAASSPGLPSPSHDVDANGPAAADSADQSSWRSWVERELAERKGFEQRVATTEALIKQNVDETKALNLAMWEIEAAQQKRISRLEQWYYQTDGAKSEKQASDLDTSLAATLRKELSSLYELNENHTRRVLELSSRLDDAVGEEVGKTIGAACESVERRVSAQFGAQFTALEESLKTMGTDLTAEMRTRRQEAERRATLEEMHGAQERAESRARKEASMATSAVQMAAKIARLRDEARDMAAAGDTVGAEAKEKEIEIIAQQSLEVEKDETWDDDLAARVKQRSERRPFTPGVLDDAARWTPDEMKSNIASMSEDALGDDAATHKLVYHFTTLGSLDLIMGGHGLRASPSGQLNGGLSVCLADPNSLQWEQWSGNRFREQVGRELWGSKWRDLLLKGRTADGMPVEADGKDADKIDYLIVLKVKNELVSDPKRIVPGRDNVCIIHKKNLTEVDNFHYLGREHIAKIYRLSNPEQEAAATQKAVVQLEEQVVLDKEQRAEQQTEQTMISPDRLDAKFSAMFEHMTQVCSSLDEKFSETAAAQDARADDSHEHMTSMVSMLDEKFATKTAQLDERAGYSHEQLSSVCEQLDAKFSQTAAAQEARAADSQQHMTHMCSALDRKSTEAFSDISARLAELDTATRDQTQRLDSQLQNQHAHFSDVSAQLDAKFSSRAAEHEARTASSHEQFTQMASMLDERFSDQEGRMEQIAAQQSARLQATEASFSVQQQSLEEKMMAVEQGSTEMCAALDAKLSDTAAAQDARAADSHQHFTHVCSSLDEKFSETAAAQDARADESHQHMASMVSMLDKKLVESTAQLDHAIDSERVERISKVAAVEVSTEATMATLERSTAERCDDLERVCTQQAQALEQRTVETCAAVDSKFTDRIAQQQDRIEATTQDLTSRVEKEFADSVAQIAQLDSKLGDVQSQVAAQMGDYLDKTEYKTQKMLTEMRVDEIEAAIGAMNEMIQEVEGPINDRITEFDEQLTEFSTDLTMLETVMTATSGL